MTEEEYQDFLNRGGKITRKERKPTKKKNLDRNNANDRWFAKLTNQII